MHLKKNNKLVSVIAGIGAALFIFAANGAAAQEVDSKMAERGKALVTNLCSRCHAVGKEGDSPLAEAPKFKNLAKEWNPESLAEAFAEGIVTGHPDMPEFVFEPEQIGELIEYFKSLEAL